MNKHTGRSHELIITFVFVFPVQVLVWVVHFNFLLVLIYFFKLSGLASAVAVVDHEQHCCLSHVCRNKHNTRAEKEPSVHHQYAPNGGPAQVIDSFVVPSGITC